MLGTKWDDEQVVDMDGGVDYTRKCIATGVIHVKVVKVVNFVLCMFYQDKLYF